MKNTVYKYSGGFRLLPLMISIFIMLFAVSAMFIACGPDDRDDDIKTTYTLNTNVRKW